MRQAPMNKKDKVLFIDTSKAKQLDVFLISEKKVITRQHLKGDYKVSEYLLKMIVQTVKSGKVKLAGLKGIVTVTGPGAFTSLRIAVAVANTLAFALQIPVASLIKKNDYTEDQMIKLAWQKIKVAKIGNYIKPYYDKQPNITKSKK